MRKKCENAECEDYAKFKVFRVDRIAADNLCDKHYAEIIGEVETKASRL